MSICSITIDFRRKRTFTDKRQVKCQRAFIPISHCSHIPVFSFLTGNCHIFPDSPIQRYCMIPYSGDRSYKTRTFRFALIHRRTVTQHIQRRFKNYILRQLTTTSALTHRLLSNIAEILFICVTHGTLRIIHRSGKHTDKRNSHIISHLIYIITSKL